MAERARFELARPFSLPAFQASALDQAMRPLHQLPVNAPRETVNKNFRFPQALKHNKVYAFLKNNQGMKKPLLRQIRLQGFRKDDLSICLLEILEKAKNDSRQRQPRTIERMNKFRLLGLDIPIANVHAPRLKIRKQAAT